MVAYLGHYDPPFAQAANDALWRVLSGHALELGISAPGPLERGRDQHAVWADPALAFAQICGLPLTTSLAGRVRLLAAPLYAFPGCDGANYRSFVVVRNLSKFVQLSDLEGAQVAVNSLDSHSGHTALRHAVAPLAKGRRYFGGQILTGAHVESLKAVGAGSADACACDCVTFGLIALHRPEWLAGLRVLAETEAAPVPPFITRGAASDREVQAWREALRRTFADPRSADARAALGLLGIALPAPDYRRIGEMFATAAEQVSR